MKATFIENHIIETVDILMQSGQFSSHDVINYISTNYSREYQQMISVYKGSRRTTNSVISNYLRYHRPRGIQPMTTKSNTYNVNGSKSDSRDWRIN